MSAPLLHAANAAGGSTQLFSRKVADYCASRPDYPPALYTALTRQVPPPASVVDIGAGTGLLTEGLLSAGYAVHAVEPDEAMRAACDARLAEIPGYRSHAGRAEVMPLPAACADLITAAQAFHWFEPELARAECQRVLRPDGWVALVWNDRADSPLNAALSALMRHFGGDLVRAMQDHDERAGVVRFFGRAIAPWTTAHAHRVSPEGLAALVFSRSYMPDRNSEAGREAIGAIQALARQHADTDGQLTLHYTCIAHIAPL